VKDFFHLPITSRQGLITSTFAVRFICRNTYRPVEQDVMLNVTKCREKSIGGLAAPKKVRCAWESRTSFSKIVYTVRGLSSAR